MSAPQPIWRRKPQGQGGLAGGLGGVSVSHMDLGVACRWEVGGEGAV